MRPPEERLLGLQMFRKNLRLLIGFLRGHYKLKEQLYNMGLTNIPYMQKMRNGGKTNTSFANDELLRTEEFLAYHATIRTIPIGDILRFTRAGSSSGPMGLLLKGVPFDACSKNQIFITNRPRKAQRKNLKFKLLWLI